MSPAPQPESLPKLTKYQIVEELGHGGMATVYRARDQRLGREVAVKIIHKHLRESVEVGRRFEAEARAVAKLRHPNIIEVYDVSGDDEPERFIVVELSRGTTLRKLLATSQPMPPEIAAALGLELARALSHAHAAGVVHRDVKPENVLVEVGSEVAVKLTDFGIAKILDAQGVTSTGQVLGSPAHMAPEQIEGGEVDARADVFGLGVLLYECMVGHLPFEGKNPAQVLRRVLDGSYAPADRDNPQVGARFARILARALAKEASDRFPSADAVAESLAAELASLGVTDTRSELARFFADPDGYRTRHRTAMAAVLTERGEKARRAGDVQGAAADFNRALCYAPQDATLLKLIGRLRRGRATRRAAVTLLVGGACAAAIGSVVVLAAKRLRSSGAGSPRETAALASAFVEPTAAKRPEPAPSAPAAVPVAKPPVERAHRVLDPAPPALREVSFVVMPSGAWVSIDDDPPEQLFSKTKRLTVGTHEFRAYVPADPKRPDGELSSCCETLRRPEEIKADEGDQGPQRVSLSLRFRDATLSAPGAPPGAHLSCPTIGVDGSASQVFSVKMSRPEAPDISCTLGAPGVPSRSSSITLRAGELNPVAWPSP